jgi:hypothetical protein
MTKAVVNPPVIIKPINNNVEKVCIACFISPVNRIGNVICYLYTTRGTGIYKERHFGKMENAIPPRTM